MSLLEQQNLLAKLYTDEEFRRKFESEPEKIGRENNLNENEIADIKEILPDEINAFADSLFYKRLREVERFLPLTRKVLEKDFENNFREFSSNYNPKSVKKHLEDAIEFAKFLREKDWQIVWLNDLIKLEQSRLEFSGFGKNLMVNVYDFDLRNISFQNLDSNSEFSRRKTVEIRIKLGKNIKHYFI